jgi:hypothetical protein
MDGFIDFIDLFFIDCIRFLFDKEKETWLMD